MVNGKTGNKERTGYMQDHPSLKHNFGSIFEHIQIDHTKQEIPKKGKAEDQQIGKSQLHGMDVKHQRGQGTYPVVDTVKFQAEFLPIGASSDQA